MADQAGPSDDHDVVGRVLVEREPVLHDEGSVGVEAGDEHPAAEEEERPRGERRDDGGAAVACAEDGDAPHDEQAEKRRGDLWRMELGDEAGEPIVYFESDWGTEEWTRGAYAASFDLGGLTRYGADQRTPVGPIHWACSDFAGHGFQHVDGGIRSGWAAAKDVIAALA